MMIKKLINKQWLRWILIVLFATLLLASISIGWLLASQSGLQWIIARALPLAPELSIDSAEGRLIGPVTLRGIRYNDKKINILINNTTFDWQPSQLFSRTVDINSLTVSGVKFQQLAPSKPTEKPAEKPTEPAPSAESIFAQLQLPVDINLHHIEILDGRYEAYQASQAIELERFQLTAKTNKKSLSITTLNLKSNIADLEGKVHLDISRQTFSETSLDGQLSWAIRAPDLKPIIGETLLLGKTKGIRINTDIKAPYNTAANIAINDIFSDINIFSSLKFNDIQFTEINAQWPNYQIAGELNAEGTAGVANITSALAIKELSSENTATVNLTGDWQDKQLVIDLLAEAPDIVKQLAIKGTIQPDQLQTKNSEAIALNIEWQELNTPAEEDNQSIQTSSTNTTLSSPTGTVKLKGNLQNYRYALDTLFTTHTTIHQEGTLQITGTGSTDQIALKEIILTGAAGTLNGDGDIQLKPTLNARMDLSGKNLNPGILATDWPGNLSLNLSVHTTQSNDELSIIYADIDSSGQLRNYPFLFKTKSNYAINQNKNDTLTIEGLQLNSGSSKISALGTFEQDKKISAEWSIISNNFDELLPNSKGKLATKGNIEASLKQGAQTTLQSILNTAKVDTDIQISQLDVSNIKIDTLTTDIDLDWSDSTTASKGNKIAIQANKISLDTLDIDSTSINANGDLNSHEMSINAMSSQGNIDLTLSGQLENQQTEPQWGFTLLSANIEIPELAPWYLQNTAKGTVSTQQQHIEQHCWLSDYKLNSDKLNDNELHTDKKKTHKASICLNGKNQAVLTQADFTITDLSTEYFLPLFPEELSWTNSLISGVGKISLTPGSSSSSTPLLNADINIATTAGKLNWQTLVIEEDTKKKKSKTSTIIQSIQLEPGKLSIQSDRKALRASLTLPLEKQPGINSSLSITASNTPFIERELTGNLGLALDNIAPFVSFIPDASDLKGKLNSQWRIGGSIAKPWIDGDLALSDGQLQLNGPGLFLEQLSLTLKGDKQSGIQYQASANSGGGTLSAKGEIKLPKEGESIPELNLSLTGEKVKVFGTEEATVFASPNLTVIANNELVSVNGTVEIPEATITPKKVPKSVINITEDQIIVDTETDGTSPQPQQNVSANIDVILGDDVLIDGFGFKGGASGKLNIQKDGQSPALGNGEINILNGEYRAFGQGLVIDKGLILFAGGPVAKPGIDIKASRRPAEGITVGVFARGSLAQPDLTIFSDPSMTQSEQLSWLVLGRPLEQSSEGENNAINQLLLSLSLDKGDSILTGLGETFNLDTMRIKTGSGEAGAASDNDLAELVLGKYLSPDLYVSYGIGLFKPVNVLSLEYSLGRRWKLTSETSAETSGGDLVYTVEK